MTAPVNVLQVCKYYYPVAGGIQRVVRSLATGVDDAEFRVLAARPRGRGNTGADEGVPVVRAGSLGSVKSTPLAPAFPYHLRRQLRWADLVHYHLPFPVGPASHLLAGDDTPVVVTFHDDIVGKGPVVYPYAPVLNRLLDAARAVVVTSPGMRDECDRVAPFADKARVIPLGVPAENTATEPKTLGGAAGGADEQQAGGERDIPRLLFVGRLVPFKGVRHLISAMGRLDATLSVVGEGPARESLERHAVAEGVADRVTFEGFVTDERLDRRYRESTAFVLPSVGRNESFGVVQLEAMQRGLPVVNTDLPTGVPFVSVDGETGFTVPPGDPDRIADAVEALLADPERYRRFSAAALDRVRERFTRDRMLAETRDVYRRALDGGAGAPTSPTETPRDRP